MSDTASGFLEVGTTPRHEVVINLPHDMTGHIVFSPHQARELARTLASKADEAERVKRQEETAVAQPSPRRHRLAHLERRPADRRPDRRRQPDPQHHGEPRAERPQQEVPHQPHEGRGDDDDEGDEERREEPPGAPAGRVLAPAFSRHRTPYPEAGHCIR